MTLDLFIYTKLMFSNIAVMLLDKIIKKNTMDKINSGFFNVSNRNFDFFNIGIQPKLFVNIPKKTQVKGEL